jgi:cytochrome c oxidase subunit 2
VTGQSHRGAVTAKNWIVLIAIMVVASAIGIASMLSLRWFPEQGSNVAPSIDTFWNVLVIVSVPIFVAVTSMLLFTVWRWRQRPGEEDLDGPPIHGSTKLEVIWTIIPTIVIAALTTYAAILLVDIQAAPAKGTRVVNVNGVQFAWDFETQTPDGPVKTTKLFLPINEPVKFNVRSKDVIHDFWVPAFRLKVDAVPGITTTYNLTPTKLGTFDVVCAELCGLGHAYMRQTVTVMTRERYDEMMAELATAAGATALAPDGAADGQGKKMTTTRLPASVKYVDQSFHGKG